MPRPTRLAKAAVCASLIALTLTACGGSGGSDDATDQAGKDSGPASTSTALDAAYKGVIGAPPTEPAAAPKGLVWVVSCGESVPTCATPSAGSVEAAEAAGMDAKLCDGKLNPQGWSDCIRQGISAKAAGIVITGQDCASLQGALGEAKAANIPVIGAGGNDCDVTGGDKLYAAIVTNLPDLTQQQWWEKMGALQADWIIGKTDGKAQVLSLEFGDTIWGGWLQDGFEKQLGTCSGCKVLDTVTIGNADVASGQLPQKFSTALLKQPTASAINVPLDGWFFAGLAQAVKQSTRSDDLAVVGNFGEPGNVDFISNNGGEDATVAFAEAWSGWAGVDALIRVLNKQDVLPAGIGLQVMDADNNLPEGGKPFSYNPVIDYKSAYTKLWTGQ